MTSRRSARAPDGSPLRRGDRGPRDRFAGATLTPGARRPPAVTAPGSGRRARRAYPCLSRASTPRRAPRTWIGVGGDGPRSAGCPLSTGTPRHRIANERRPAETTRLPRSRAFTLAGAAPPRERARIAQLCIMTPPFAALSAPAFGNSCQLPPTLPAGLLDLRHLGSPQRGLTGHVSPCIRSPSIMRRSPILSKNQETAIARTPFTRSPGVLASAELPRRRRATRWHTPRIVFPEMTRRSAAGTPIPTRAAGAQRPGPGPGWPPPPRAGRGHF